MRDIHPMEFAVALLLALSTGLAQAEVLRLTSDTWAQGTLGKTVFVKFFAPWCGKCQELAPAWEKLAEQWKDNSVGLIAEVDCDDDDNHVLCEEMEINQYPTLLFGDPFEMELYDGNLELEDLSEFAKEHLVTPICSPANLDACAEDEKTVITELQGRSVEELTSLEDKAAELLHHAHLDYEEEIENLQNLREKLDTSHHEKLQAIHQEYNYKHLRKVLALKRDEIKSEEL